MADQWYYARGREKVGPFTAAQLKQLARSGQLARSDMVWKEGTAKWMQAAQVRGLFDSTPSHGGQRPVPPPLPPSKGAATTGTDFESLDDRARPVLSGKRARGSRSSRALWVCLAGGGLVVVLAFLVVFLLRSGDDPTLTKEFFPQSGTERRLVRKQFADDGAVKEKAFTVIFSPDLETMSPTGQPMNKQTIKHRQKDGYLEYLRPDRKDWTRFMKLGARPGDSWEYKYGEGKGQYTYKEFTRINGKPCAVLEYVFFLDGKPRIKTTEWYLKGVGYVRYETHQSDEQGNWKKMAEAVFAEWPGETDRRVASPARQPHDTPAAETVDFARGPKGEEVTRVEEGREQKSGFKDRRGKFVRHGPYVLFYDRVGGKKKWQGECYSGRWHGKLTGWYEDGTLWFERWYDKGEPVGTHKGYDGKGKQVWTLRFENGKPRIAEVDCYCLICQLSFLYGTATWKWIHPNGSKDTVFRFTRGERAAIPESEFLWLMGQPQQRHDVLPRGYEQDWVYRCKDGTVTCRMVKFREPLSMTQTRVSGRRKF